MTQTTISLIRHGEVYNPQKIFYGRLPRFGLSDLGREQAHRAARYVQASLPRVTAVFTSPLLRARQTAAIIVDDLPASPPIKRTKKLIEVHTPHDGQPLSYMLARNWDLYSGLAPEYEQPDDIVRRTQQWIGRMRRDFAGQHVIGVTHGDVVMYQIMWALNRPFTLEEKFATAQTHFDSDYLHTASVSTFVYETSDMEERPAFRYFGQ